MKIIGVDFGTVRIGLAISDENRLLARPLPFLTAKKNLKQTAELLRQELSKFSPLETVVIGLPLHLNGKESELSLQVRELEKLLKESFPVILWDERLSTAQVEKTLKEMDFSRKKRTERIDSVAAAAILQNYLDFCHERKRSL